MDDLSRKRFEKIAQTIALNLVKGKQAITDLMAAVTAIEALLLQYVDGLERITGPTAAIKSIRREVEVAWKVFEDPNVFAGIDAALDHFDTAAEALLKLVNDLPDQSE